MKKWLNNWLFEIKENQKEISLSIIFFIVVGLTFYFLGNYLDKRAGVVLPDILLDNLPTLKFMGPVFVFGIFFFIALLILYPLIFRVKDFARTMEQFSLLIMIRNAFLPLNGLASHPEAVSISFPWIINNWNFHNDLFFSGHVAIPLLGFFLFRDSKIKYVFLGGAILLGISALFTHLHYSIDVFAGIFIGYGSYKFGEWIFGKVEEKTN